VLSLDDESKIHVCNCLVCGQAYARKFNHFFERVCLVCVHKHGYKRCVCCQKQYQCGLSNNQDGESKTERKIDISVGDQAVGDKNHCSSCREKYICIDHNGYLLVGGRRNCYICEQQDDEDEKNRQGTDYGHY
jgi:hypothetical protein